MLQVLAGGGNLAQAEQLDERYRRELTASADAGEIERQAALASQLTVLYLKQDFAGLLTLALQPELAGSAAYFRYQCHLEMGQCAAAAADLKSQGGTLNPTDLLRLSVCARTSGDLEKAAEWQDLACAQFERGQEDQREISKLLRRAADVTVQDTRDVSADAGQKAILLIALAQQSKDHRDELLALAERLNYSRLFPYHFNRKAIEALRGAN